MRWQDLDADIAPEPRIAYIQPPAAQVNRAGVILMLSS
jgi:hypothetical protein